MLDFLEHVFQAEVARHEERPSEVRLGETLFLVSTTDVRENTRSMHYVYVDDVEQVFSRAVAAGASVREAPQTMPYGELRCTFDDPEGNTWQVAEPAGG